MPSKLINSDDIVFDEDIQNQCVSPGFRCPNYKSSWSCPPESPYLEKKVRSFDRFFLIYSIFNIKEYIESEKKKHPKKSENLIRYSLYDMTLNNKKKSPLPDLLEKEVNIFVENYNQSYGEMLILWAGTCRLCPEKLNESCAYIKGKSCRFPDEIRYSMESVGIDVMKTVKNVDLPIENPSREFDYRFALICFK